MDQSGISCSTATGMECHVAHCPAQKLLNNHRHKTEISLKCPFAADETTRATTGTIPEHSKDIHRSAGASNIASGHQRLTHGCTSLMYACQRGDTGGIIRELRNKVSTKLRQIFPQLFVPQLRSVRGRERKLGHTFLSRSSFSQKSQSARE